MSKEHCTFVHMKGKMKICVEDLAGKKRVFEYPFKDAEDRRAYYDKVVARFKEHTITFTITNNELYMEQMLCESSMEEGYDIQKFLKAFYYDADSRYYLTTKSYSNHEEIKKFVLCNQIRTPYRRK